MLSSLAQGPVIHLHIAAKQRARGRSAAIRRAALAALAPVILPSSPELAIRITNDAELRELNKTYRGFDKPTDVLSFGGDGWRDGAMTPRGGPVPPYLGDLAISIDRCAEQAQAGGHATDAELALLVIHGVLHLVGYDHDTAARKAKMWRAQAAALAAIGLTVTVP